MTNPGGRQGLQHAVRAELRHLATMQASDRPWQMPLAAALASGAPLLAGAAFGRLDYGVVGSLGTTRACAPASAAGCGGWCRRGCRR